MKRFLYLLAILCFTNFHTSIAQSKVATLTYLKSIDREKDNLKDFLKRNWFVMDSIAKQQNLIEHYALWENPTSNQDWDLIVHVVYKDEKGYEGIANAFEKIRSTHKKILINNKDLKQLGNIVKSETVLIHP